MNIKGKKCCVVNKIIFLNQNKKYFKKNFRFCLFTLITIIFIIIINFLKGIQIYDLWPKTDIFKSTKTYRKLLNYLLPNIY